MSKVLVDYTVKTDAITFKENVLSWIDGTKNIKSGDFCIDVVNTLGKNKTKKTFKGQQLLFVRTCEDYKTCKAIPCVRKCCTDGETYVRGNDTTFCKNYESNIKFQSFPGWKINVNFSKSPAFGVLRGLDCPKFRLDPDSFLDEAHIINASDGSLIIRSTKKTYSNSQYCLENVRSLRSKDQKLFTFVCFDSKVIGNDRIRFKMYPVGLLISCCFYALTLLVYMSIAKLRNLPGKILICLVSNLFSAYMGIALGQLWPTSKENVCFISDI
ncbi:probable G-protein coupled receptor Mth-like 12 [Drosophila tropicalis]|uniref:probable G-protein coupled receptor Mth-like 12 n=1 Tax=Drosophila tropicalis TaxID=46794 RepID=UPI0035AC0A09